MTPPATYRAVPSCPCHGVRMGWGKDARYRAGGHWRCSVKHRAEAAAYKAAHREEKRASNAAWKATPKGQAAEALRSILKDRGLR